MKPIHKLLDKVLPYSPCIYEIGAHHGEDSLKFLKLRSSSRITMFEADPRCIDAIEASVPCEEFNVRLIKKAVSSENKENVEWYSSTGLGGDWDHSSSLRAPKEHFRKFPGVGFNRKHTVDQITLDSMHIDDWFSPRIDFMWIDVQGAEYDVFAGGLETLKRTHYVWFECYDNIEVYEGQRNLEDIMNLLPSWEIILKDGDDYLIRNNDFIGTVYESD